MKLIKDTTELINVIAEKVTTIESESEIEIFEYWHPRKVEKGKNTIYFRDGETFYSRISQQHEAKVLVEFTGVIFDEQAAILGTRLLTELIKWVGKNKTWGFNSCNTELIRSEKFVDIQGEKSCEVVLETLIKYRTNLFHL